MASLTAGNGTVSKVELKQVDQTQTLEDHNNLSFCLLRSQSIQEESMSEVGKTAVWKYLRRVLLEVLGSCNFGGFRVDGCGGWNGFGSGLVDEEFNGLRDGSVPLRLFGLEH
jgi:hypothetical protein